VAGYVVAARRSDAPWSRSYAAFLRLGLLVLAAVAAPLRYDSGALLCAIAGYPHAGCGDQVAAGSNSGAGKGGSDGGPSLGLLAGAGAVVLLGAGAVWQARRRRTR
jgi:hypothetical protein